MVSELNLNFFFFLDFGRVEPAPSENLKICLNHCTTRLYGGRQPFCLYREQNIVLSRGVKGSREIVNMSDERGFSSLHAACSLETACSLEQKLETAKYLISVGSDKNKGNNNGETALFIACHLGVYGYLDFYSKRALTKTRRAMMEQQLS